MERFEHSSIQVTLWLIPMGHIAVGSGLMPKWLGRVLIVGGSAYVLSALVSYPFSDLPGWLVQGLALPATVGEFG